jgi:hypothetical protein
MNCLSFPSLWVACLYGSVIIVLLDIPYLIAFPMYKKTKPGLDREKGRKKQEKKQ